MIKSNKGLVFRLAAACIGATVILSTQVCAQAVKVDAVSVSDAYTRATVPGQKVAGGFLKIQNNNLCLGVQQLARRPEGERNGTARRWRA